MCISQHSQIIIAIRFSAGLFLCVLKPAKHPSFVLVSFPFRAGDMAPTATQAETPVSSAKSFLKPNIGVYTNPNHDLWINPAEPTAESVAAGSDLKPGEVTIAIRSTGICG